MDFCEKCGTQFDNEENFCSQCGHPIRNNASEPQQQVNQNLQANDEKGEKGLKIWIKILIILLWPIGLILGIIYKRKKEKRKTKEAIFYCFVGIGATIGIYCNMPNRNSSITNLIETSTKDLMINEYKKQGVNLVVNTLKLTPINKNEYSGVAICTVDGEEAKFSLKVLLEGTNINAEWELSEMDNDALGDDEEEEFTDNNPQADDIAKCGYNDGYEDGFRMDISSDMMEMIIKNHYTSFYGAPRTSEERELYIIFKENYERGYRDGKNATN